MVQDRFLEDQDHTHDEGWWESVLGDEEVGAFTIPAKPQKIEEQRDAGVEWDLALELFRNDQVLTLTVTGHNRGGLLVEGNALYGFIPCSHLVNMPPKAGDDEREECLQAHMGHALQLKIIECVPDEGRLVFSERAAQAGAGKRTVLFSSLKPYQRVRGVVTNVTDFGVFIDLGGVEGLIHISELSWGRVTHPSQVLSINQSVEVMVLEVIPERCRVALSLKRLVDNPWETAEQRYPINVVVPAQVTTIVPYGAFARLEEGLEGLIHVSEIPLPPKTEIKDILKAGQGVQVRILQVDAGRQRLGLSLKLQG